MDFSKISIAHVTDTMSAKAGGVPAVVRHLVSNIFHYNGSSSILYAKGDASDVAKYATLFECPPKGLLRSWDYSPDIYFKFRDCLRSLNSQYPIVHIHGLWSAPATVTSFLAASRGIPLIFSAHGELEPWLWNGQGFKKRIKKIAFWHILGERAHSKSSIIHAITPLEKENLHKLFPKAQIEIIPNSIFVKSSTCSPNDFRKSILFLGRIDIKKGVDVLIKSFALARLHKEWHLDIVGPCFSDHYLNFLKKLASSFSVESQITFHGPVFGDKKLEFLMSSWILAVPSHSEAIGLVNLEAGACFLPSLTTYQTGLFDWNQGGGLLSNNSIQDYSSCLIEASNWSLEERIARGKASRALVLNRYTWDVNLPKWQSMYSTFSS